MRSVSKKAAKEFLVHLTGGGGGPSGSFSPSNLPNLVAWYDASDISTLFQDTGGTTPVTTDGQSVALWKDKSGNGNHLAQPTAGNRSIYVSNAAAGKQALQITHTSDVYPPTAPIPLTGVFTAYVVGHKAASKTYPFFGGSLTGANAGIEIYNDGRLFVGNDAGQEVDFLSSQSGNLAFRHRRTAANECWSAWTGMSDTRIGTLSGLITIGQAAGSGFLHWDLPDINQQFNEILLWATDLVADGTDTLVRSYLQTKYSLTIP